MGKSASIFVLYLTTQAKKISDEENRKTIAPLDIIRAVSNIGFEEFEGELSRTLQGAKKQHEETKKKRAEKQKLKAQSNPQSLLSSNNDTGDGQDEPEQEERSTPDPEVIEIDEDD